MRHHMQKYFQYGEHTPQQKAPAEECRYEEEQEGIAALIAQNYVLQLKDYI